MFLNKKIKRLLFYILFDDEKFMTLEESKQLDKILDKLLNFLENLN